jgi:hypothetical protein
MPKAHEQPTGGLLPRIGFRPEPMGAEEFDFVGLDREW